MMLPALHIHIKKTVLRTFKKIIIYQGQTQAKHYMSRIYKYKISLKYLHME